MWLIKKSTFCYGTIASVYEFICIWCKFFYIVMGKWWHRTLTKLLYSAYIKVCIYLNESHYQSNTIETERFYATLHHTMLHYAMVCYVMLYLFYHTIKVVMNAVNVTVIMPFDLCPTNQWNVLTLKHREMHGCVVSTVATDALVLKHQAISILSTD